MTCTKRMFTGLISVFTLVGAAQAADVYIDGTGNQTVATAIYRLSGIHNWVSTNEYYLKGFILVGSNAVLNIEAGTIIRGVNDYYTDTEYRPGALIVERGGKIYANGTATNPIVMTDQWDDHFPWKAPKYGTGTTKTRTWRYHYGGTGYMHNDDSSGEIRYLQIRYGGAITTSKGKEINGLTLYGVGRGTVLDHIEVYNNQDDGIEWFGGTVNAKHLVVWGAGDDTFDSDAGFRGKNQFLFGVQRNLGGNEIESGCSDKGMEMDGFEKTSASGAMLFSASLWANITLIGADYDNSNHRNAALSMRDNASPQIYNSVFMDFGSKATFIENWSNTADGIALNTATRFETANTLNKFPQWKAYNAFGVEVGPEYFYKAQVPGNQACIRGSVFWNIREGFYPDQVGPTALMGEYGWITGGADGKGPYVDAGKTLYSGWLAEQEGNVASNLLEYASVGNGTEPENDDATEDNGMPIKRRYRTPTTRGPAMSGRNAYDITEIDPRAANDAVTGAMYIPDSWITPTAYRGAFGPSNNWAKGWTTIASMGVFGAGTANDPQEVEPLVDNTVYVTNTVETVITNTVETVVTNGVNGIVYQDNGAAFGGTNTVAALAIQTSPVVTYTIAETGTYQLQYTASLTEVDWQPIKTFTATSAPVTVNLTDIIGVTPEHAGDAAFYRLMKQQQ